MPAEMVLELEFCSLLNDFNLMFIENEVSNLTKLLIILIIVLF